MSDDNIKESTLGGKKEALSKALREDEPVAKEEPVMSEKAFIPTAMSVTKKEQAEAILILGGDIAKKGLDQIAGLTYKTPVEAPKTQKISFNDITIDDVDGVLVEHEKKAEYFRSLKSFLQRYDGMSKEEIKKEVEAGLKYIDFLDAQ